MTNAEKIVGLDAEISTTEEYIKQNETGEMTGEQKFDIETAKMALEMYKKMRDELKNGHEYVG